MLYDRKILTCNLYSGAIYARVILSQASFRLFVLPTWNYHICHRRIGDDFK